jgi:hypothetical protein
MTFPTAAREKVCIGGDSDQDATPEETNVAPLGPGYSGSPKMLELMSLTAIRKERSSALQVSDAMTAL